jgi:hypothetical protein
MTRFIFLCGAIALVLWALPVSAGPFVDVEPLGHYDESGIWGLEQLQAEGFIEGYPGDYFRPNRAWSRYETAMVLARVLDRFVTEISAFNPPMADALSAQATVPSEMSFIDVPSDHWAYESVKVLENVGVLIGHPGAKFDGNRSVTRLELSAMLSRLWQLLPSPFGKNVPSVEQTETPLFTDLPEDNWAYPDVAFLARIGVLEAYPDGTVRGQRTFTRCEMVMIVARVWDRFLSALQERRLSSQDGGQ